MDFSSLLTAWLFCRFPLLALCYLCLLFAASGCRFYFRISLPLLVAVWQT
jgi:hypothetical protein